MNGGAALLPQMTTNRGRYGNRDIISRHPYGIGGTHRPFVNRVGFVDELWFSKLGDVRPQHGKATNCRRFWYNRVPACTHQGETP